MVTGGRPGRVPGVIYEEGMEGAFRMMQARFGQPRMIGQHIVPAAVTDGPW